MPTAKQIKYWKSLLGNKINTGREKRPGEGFQKGHKFIKGGERGWFKKGQISWKKGTAKIHICLCINCGISFKVSDAIYNKGRKFCSRKCMGEHYKKIKQRPPVRRMFGRDNPQWKNGATPKSKLLRGGSQFKKWRKEVFGYDNYICWICELNSKHLHPHHLKSFSKYPELRFVKSNGLTLCEFCHRTYTDFGIQNQNG